MATQLIQQQVPDYLGSITKGYEAGQNMRFNQMKIQAAQQEMQQKQEISALMRLAPHDPQAMKFLAMRAPEAAKGLRDQQDYSIVQGAKVLDGFNSLPVYAQTQEKWDNLHANYRQATGGELPLPSNLSDEARIGLKSLSTRLKGREQELKEEKEFQGINLTKANIATEKMQPAKISADIAKTKADTAKTYEDLNAVRAERQAAANAGLTPAAFKKQQELLVEAQTKKQIALPQAQANANQAVQLVQDIISHPGKSSMVGSRLGFGSVNTYLPNWMGGKSPIAGTDAANFMAKFEQLQGKQFLEAFETLKGGGAISEAEGEKATKAISSMQTAQSEEEFDKAGREFIDVITKAIERQGGSAPKMSAPEGTVVKGKDGKTYTKTGGGWQENM